MSIKPLWMRVAAWVVIWATWMFVVLLLLHIGIPIAVLAYRDWPKPLYVLLAIVGWVACVAGVRVLYVWAKSVVRK